MDLWAVLLPVLLTDVVNPVLFAFMVYTVASDRPVLLSSSMLFGHTLAYFGAGILLAMFMNTIAEYLANPGTLDFVIELVLGVILLALVFGSRKGTGKRPDEETPRFTVLSAFFFGTVVNFIGIPFAVPYFAAIDQILKADVSVAKSVLLLLSYNLLYALPFALVPVLSAVMGDRAKPVLERMGGHLDKLSGFLMPILLGLVGLALVADAGSYFLTGTSLF